jgi:hypothetical protein
MSEFMLLDAKAPATMEAVVEAVLRLSALSEEQLLEIVSAGKLSEMFPFRPNSGQQVPPDFVADEDLVEASALPMSWDQQKALIDSSMPSDTKSRPRQGIAGTFKRSTRVK